MELATRAKVARVIDTEVKRTGVSCVYLVISDKNCEFLKKKFPTMSENSLKLYPVVTAALVCNEGGVDVCGRANWKNNLLLGESSCTGLHGGNILSITILFEAIVSAKMFIDIVYKSRFVLTKIKTIESMNKEKLVKSGLMKKY